MLSKEGRISQSLFTQIIKEGRSFGFKNFSLRFCLRGDHKKSAFSFVVSSKEVKKAVWRNLIKRRGRAVVKKNSNRIKAGYLYAFFLKKSLVSKSFIEFETEIMDGLKEINLLE